MFNGAINMSFDPKHPFAPNNISSKVRRNKNPSLIVEQGIKFKIHSSMPVWVLHSRGIACWFGEKSNTNTIGKESTWKWVSNCAINKFFWLGDMILD